MFKITSYMSFDIFPKIATAYDILILIERDAPKINVIHQLVITLHVKCQPVFINLTYQ